MQSIEQQSQSQIEFAKKANSRLFLSSASSQMVQPLHLLASGTEFHYNLKNMKPRYSPKKLEKYLYSPENEHPDTLQGVRGLVTEMMGGEFVDLFSTFHWFNSEQTFGVFYAPREIDMSRYESPYQKGADIVIATPALQDSRQDSYSPMVMLDITLGRDASTGARRKKHHPGVNTKLMAPVIVLPMGDLTIHRNGTVLTFNQYIDTFSRQAMLDGEYPFFSELTDPEFIDWMSFLIQTVQTNIEVCRKGVRAFVLSSSDFSPKQKFDMRQKINMQLNYAQDFFSVDPEHLLELQRYKERNYSQKLFLAA